MKRFAPPLLLGLLLLAACASDAAPSTPKGLRALPGDSKLTLSWTANSETDLKGYLLSWQPVAGGTSQSRAVGLTTSAVIDELQNGVAYLVTIAAEDEGSRRSPPSAAVSAVPQASSPPPQTTPPAQPSGLKASPQDGQVALTWTPNSEADLDHYTLYWGRAARGSTKRLPSPHLPTAPSSRS